MDAYNRWGNHRIMVVVLLFLCHFPYTSLGNVLVHVLMPVSLRLIWNIIHLY